MTLEDWAIAVLAGGVVGAWSVYGSAPAPMAASPLASSTLTAVSVLPNSKPVEIAPEPTSLLTTEQIHAIVLRALRRTIAEAEGTWSPGQAIDPYTIMFGGGSFSGFDHHPDSVICGGGYCSSAAGGYQFMPFTWDDLRNRYAGWPSKVEFSPENQDYAIFLLLREAGAWAQIEGGISVLNQRVAVDPARFAASMDAAADVWCSLPGYNRGLCSGQPQRSLEFVSSRFYEELDKAQETAK